MKKLSKLPNINKSLEKRLSAVEINDVDTFYKLGSKISFLKLYLHEGNTCFYTLCALEGAIQGVNKNHISFETKIKLKQFFNSL